jgi:hypothetical protein
MKASELIEALKDAVRLNGDLPVTYDLGAVGVEAWRRLRPEDSVVGEESIDLTNAPRNDEP